MKQLLRTEGAIAVLHDEFKGDLFVLGAAYDDMAIEKRVAEFRFSKDQLVAGEVLRTGEPVIISDTSINRHLHEERDKKFGYHTRNLVVVPLKSSERITGALCAINKKEAAFDHSDVELLSMIAGTVALSIENARFSEDLKKALRTNEALLRISLALPKYSTLEDLLDFVNNEIKRLLDTEGAVVLLVDEEKQELVALGAAYDCDGHAGESERGSVPYGSSRGRKGHKNRRTDHCLGYFRRISSPRREGQKAGLQDQESGSDPLAGQGSNHGGPLRHQQKRRGFRQV